MTGRDAILAKVRAGVAAGETRLPGHEAERAATVADRLAVPPRNLVPARARERSEAERVAILRQWVELAGGHFAEVGSLADLPAAVAGYLRSHNAPLRVRIGKDRLWSGVTWASAPQLEIARGRSDGSDTASVTHAIAAVAETGTMVVPSGPANPVTLSFLPETNIVVVERGNVVGPLEEALLKVRSAGGMPRTLNLISGPSRSADIGGVPVLGAHGPKRLAVMVIG